MKKAVFILLAVVLLLAAGAVVYLYLTDPDGAQAMVDGKLIPIAIVAITTIFTIFCAVYPLLERANSVIDKTERSCKSFDEAADGIESGNAQNGERYLRLEEAVKELSQKVESGTRAAEQNDRALSGIREMLRVGLGNIPDLVRGGYAREISKIADAGLEGNKEEKGEKSGDGTETEET